MPTETHTSFPIFQAYTVILVVRVLVDVNLVFNRYKIEKSFPSRLVISYFSHYRQIKTIINITFRN